MATTAAGLMTAEELALLPDDGDRYEPIKGMPGRMSPGAFEASNIAARVTARLVIFSDEPALGEVTVADGRYVLERGPDTVRAPDVAFVRADRVPTPEQQQHFAELAPDLAVEAVSPSDRTKDGDEKAKQNLALGVPLVWGIHPRHRAVTVRRLGRKARVPRDGDVIDGEEILPGFRLPVAEIDR